jgi:hypothetical protein
MFWNLSVSMMVSAQIIQHDASPMNERSHNAEHHATPRQVVEQHDALRHPERIVIAQAHHAGAEPDVAGALGRDGDEDLRRRDDLAACRVGAYLMLAHEWATPKATRKNYELIARYVMPQFKGQASSTLQAKTRAEAARPDLAAQQARAVQAMSEKHKAEVAAQIGS